MMLELHVVPTWNGRWAILRTSAQVRRWERFWRWYWPLVARPLGWCFPSLWPEE
jgi:hypothetical protein